jgi:lipid-A-disaccharide synthase
MKQTKIYIIAGEASGDNIGAKLIEQLKKSSKFPLEFYGVGGKKMQAQGLQSLFPMHEISIIGFAEIIRHIPNLLKRLKQTFNHIKQIQPDCVITIDAPGFNKRIAKKLCEELPDIKRIHYVAPTVWAYKPERAKKMAELFNHLLVLLPFEPPYFEAENLPTTFTGHPIFEDFPVGEAPQQNPNNKNIAILVGSRKGEINRLLPIFVKTIELLNKKHADLNYNFLSSDEFSKIILQKTSHLKNINVITDEVEKKSALKNSAAALVKSGTISLEVALSRVPMVIAYKVSAISAYMLRKMILVKFVTLLNIVANKEIIPEFLQEACTAENLSNALGEFLSNPEVANKQIAATNIALQQLGYGQEKLPSEIAAETVLEILHN